MAVGLPGTGIGGLFYLLLGAVAPLRRGVRALRSQTEARSYRSVLITLGLLAGIVATMWGQAWLLGELIRAVHSSSHGPSGAIAVLTGPTAAVYMRWAGLAGLLGLGFVFCGVHLLRVIMRRRRPGGRLPDGRSSGRSSSSSLMGRSTRRRPPGPSAIRRRTKSRIP